MIDIKSAKSSQEIWQELRCFESRDLVIAAFQQRHGREPNQVRVREVTASIVQGREYFKNAETAAVTVRPLLQYYGVASLVRALAIFVLAQTRPDEMPSAHGLQHKGWREALASGLRGLNELRVTVQEGLFTDLLRATQNTSYLCDRSVTVNKYVAYPIPAVGTEILFTEVASVVPNLNTDYRAWIGNDGLLNFSNDSIKPLLVQRFGTVLPVGEIRAAPLHGGVYLNP
jgi:hypothetical protein